MPRTIILTLAAILAIAACAGAATVSAPKSVQLTAYTSDIGLVKDTRTVELVKGANSVEVTDIAAQLDPTSILIRSLTDPGSVTILEQRFLFDVITPESILSRSVGERVTFTQWDENGAPHVQQGVLLNAAVPGQIVIRADDGNIILNPVGQISVPKMPIGLQPKPTLAWLMNAEKAGAQSIEISYITNGINWRADYVALVNADETRLNLSAWVSLTNTSGATYNDAQLTLVAGDVRRVQMAPPPRPEAYGGGMMMKADMAAPQFQQAAFSEYHLYTLSKPTTVADKETKQLSLLEAGNVPVTKEMVFDGRGPWFRGWYYPGRIEFDPGNYDTSNHKVNVTLEFTNSQANNIGMPLPGGRVRVYKLDTTGSQRFIGEDQIDHTAKDEKVRLYIGDAFDVVGDYKRTNYNRISDKVVEESFEVTIRNHKTAPVNVKIVEHVFGTWQVTEKSQDYTKKDANTIEFPVTVGPDKAVTVTYTIRTSW